MKQTKGKPKWHLINLKVLEGMLGVLEFGNNKYKETGEQEWRDKDPLEYLDALTRHLSEVSEQGILAVDKESGLQHIDHVGACFYILSSMLKEIKDGSRRIRRNNIKTHSKRKGGTR